MKFLIVEDDIISQEILKAILASYGHCEVAENGEIAVRKFANSLETADRYDVIFMDIMMPVMDGQTALKTIRGLEAKQGIGGTDMINVVMVTALEDAGNVMEAFAKGACEGYMTKPIIPAKIEKILRDLELLK